MVSLSQLCNKIMSLKHGAKRCRVPKEQARHRATICSPEDKMTASLFDRL